jgi:UDP-2,3-diacylglucosamine hydrolase
VGVRTIDTMMETGATALAIDADRTLLLDKLETLQRADAAGITIAAYPAEEEKF